MGAKLDPSKLSLTVVMIISIIITISGLVTPHCLSGVGGSETGHCDGHFASLQEMQFVQEELKFTEPH